MKKMNPKLLERLEKGFTVKVPRRIIEILEAQQVPRKTKLPTTRKQSLREREDAEMLKRSQGIYGVQLPTEYDDAPGSVEELLRRCEEEMRGHEGFDEVFRLPLGTALPEKQRDFADAAWFLYEARDKLKGDDQEGATLELFKLARILERLRVLEVINQRDRKSKADGYLEGKFYDAWKSLRTDDEPNPSFMQVFCTLEEKGIIKEKLAYTKYKNPDGSHIKKPSGRWQWKEPGIREYQTLAFRRLESLFDGWRKEWLRLVNKRARG